MIYVITAVHNRYAITEAFVKRLLAQSEKDWNLILVDDGSTDGTADMVKNLVPEAVILTGDGDLWWGGALHEAYKYVKANVADSDYVFISNDDVDFPDDYVERAIAILEKNPDTILTGCGISKQTGEQVDGAVSFDFLKGGGTRGQGDESTGNCASTRSIFLRALDMKKIDHSMSGRTLKQIFRKRSTSNPMYKATFCFLASPWGKKTASFVCQCWRTVFPKRK